MNVDWHTAHTLASYAMRSGAVQTGAVSYRWHTAGGCLDPVAVNIDARPDKDRAAEAPFLKAGELPVFLEMKVRCRRCAVCRAKRQFEWTKRAAVEIFLANRTWFQTLTFNPSSRANIEFQIHENFSYEVRSLLDDLDDMYLARVYFANQELTKYLKRIRKNTGAKMRYMAVWEPHKDGYPHAHLLIHEREGSIKFRDLDGDVWGLGFTRPKLVDDTSPASYLTKYVTKERGVRLRASLRYGQPTPAALAASAPLKELCELEREPTDTPTDPQNVIPFPVDVPSTGGGLDEVS